MDPEREAFCRGGTHEDCDEGACEMAAIENVEREAFEQWAAPQLRCQRGLGSEGGRGWPSTTIY